MFRAFNIEGCQWDESNDEAGNAVFDENRESVAEPLEIFLNGKIVDGTKLTKHWFPVVEADVFISHSHDDREQAIRCAGWLKSKLGLTAFVDSCVWGYADALLRQLDDKYCLNPNGRTYSYPKRNRSTSHVHMMLSSALSAMIDATECAFFMKSKNSITSRESIHRTESPWIFYELATMRIIRRRKPVREYEILVENLVRTRRFSVSKLLRLEHEVPLSELTTLGLAKLLRWHKTCTEKRIQGKAALDQLYEIIPEPDEEGQI